MRPRQPQCRTRVATALFATTVPTPTPRGAVLLREENVGARRLDASRGAAWGGVPHEVKGETCMDIILGLLVLLAPLLVVLTVLASLGWLALAVFAGVGWVGKQLLRLTRGVVRNA